MKTRTGKPAFPGQGDRRHAFGSRLARGIADAQHDERRADVYRADIGGGEDPFPRLPPAGPARNALVTRLRELKADGASHLQAAAALGIDPGQVSRLCTQHNIPSLKPQGRKKGYDRV